MITQTELHNLLTYNQETGEFKHLTSTTHKKIGDVAGFVHKGTGYYHICTGGREYKAHRLAFLYIRGYMPDEIDHKNRIKLDNRWCNLRKADRSLNCTNQGLRKDNQTGVRGLSFNGSNKYNPWTFRRQRNGTKTQQSFASKEEALKYIESITNGLQ